MQLFAICAFVAAATANPAPLLAARDDQAVQGIAAANAANANLFTQHPQLKLDFEEAKANAIANHAAVMLAANGEAAEADDCDGLDLPILGCVTADQIKNLTDAASDSSSSDDSEDDSSTKVQGPPLYLFDWLGRPVYPGYPSSCSPSNPYSCYGPQPLPYYPFNVGPGPGNGSTSCGDLDSGVGYICNDAHNELSYCFKGAGGQDIGSGSFTVQKCGFFGGCGSSDDGKMGLCYY